MKNVLLGAMLVISGLAGADELSPAIKVGRQAPAVRVDSVMTETVGEHGFPSTRVLVRATFGNRCAVAKSNELISITQHSKNFEDLNITLANESHRVCPAVYAPVTVTIDLGLFTKPNDGHFRQISVNGKLAD